MTDTQPSRRTCKDCGGKGWRIAGAGWFFCTCKIGQALRRKVWG